MTKASAAALRYRFFLIAGVFPYLLGAAVAYHAGGMVDWRLLFVGLAGIVAVSLGIEGMNEYFDARLGGDRVFSSAERTGARWHLPLGLSGFVVALLVALYLTYLRGWPVLGLAVLGALAAFSYLIPPVHLSYRGLGETVITGAYGPGLTLGSFYLQIDHLSWTCAFVSLLPALLMFALTLANEVPDYYGDRLVGKRNLIVRLGRRGGACLYVIFLGLSFALIIIGLLAGVFPRLLWFALLLVPLALWNAIMAVRFCETPPAFCRIINNTIFLYISASLIGIAGYVL
ncbi:MAG: prenyltransferase [Planctomycetes bacterium]|nr:prenyltransferase [Planctomycetota bacterium]